MTKTELEQKTNEINQSNDSTESKAARIEFLNKTYSDYETRTAEAAKQKQAAAEAELKARFKNSYMQNPVATAEDFERDYPQMKSDHLRGEAVKSDAAARDAQKNAMRDSF